MIEVAILLGILLVSWSLAAIYKFGKRTAFDLIEQHVKSGSSVEIALQYERDVMEGKVPRG